MERKLVTYADYTESNLLDKETIPYDLNKISKDGLSLYQIDYIIVHFSEMVQREISKNPDIIYNPQFQNFMNLATKFRDAVVKSRSDTGNGKCGLYNKELDEALNKVVNSQILNPLIYNYYFADLNIKTGTIKDDLKKAYVKICDDPLILNLINDYLIPAANAFNMYQNTNNSDVEKESVKLDKIIKEINYKIQKGDYSEKYASIQNLFNNSVLMLDNLASAYYTEQTIIDKNVDITGNFNNLKFTNSDIDPALVISSDPVDLVSYDEYNKLQQRNNQKFAKMSSSNIISDIYGKSNSSTNNNVAELINQLTTTINLSTNIDASPELNKLAFTKIYEDNDGEKVAEYLDEIASENLQLRTQQNQNAYLDRMDNGSTSRGVLYEQKYPKKKFKGGSQQIQITQTGGRPIDIPNLIIDSDNNSTNMKTIKDKINEINRLTNKQNNKYFQNNLFMDIDGLKQRNQYLFEIMKILNAHTMTINNKTESFENLTKEIEKYMLKIKQILNDLQQMTSSTLDSVDNMDGMINNSALTAREIRDLLEEDETLGPLIANPIIVEAKSLNILGKLIDNKSNNDSRIRKILRDIINYNIDDQKYDSPTDLYDSLQTYYTKLDALNKELEVSRNGLDLDKSDLDKLEKITGDIIDSNIEIVNIYVRELILSLETYNFSSNNLQKTLEQKTKFNKRIQDFSLYLDEIKFKLRDKKSPLTLPSPSKDIINHNLNLDNFYDTYVTQYLDKILKSTNSFSKINVYEKKYYDLKIKSDDIEEKARKYQFIYSDITRPVLNDLKIKTPSNLDGFVDEIYKYIITFNKLYLNAYPELMNSLPIGLDISYFFDNFIFINTDVLNRIVEIYVPTNNDGTLKDIFMRKNDHQTLVLYLMKLFINKLNFVATNAIQGTADDVRKLERALRKMNKIYLNFKKNKDAVIKEFVKLVKKSIGVEKLIDTAKLKRLIRENIRAKGNNVSIANQFNTVTNNYVLIYSNSLTDLYQSYLGASLLDPEKKSYFNELMIDEVAISKINRDAQYLRISNNYPIEGKKYLRDQKTYAEFATNVKSILKNMREDTGLIYPKLDPIILLDTTDLMNKFQKDAKDGELFIRYIKLNRSVLKVGLPKITDVDDVQKYTPNNKFTIEYKINNPTYFEIDSIIFLPSTNKIISKNDITNVEKLVNTVSIIAQIDPILINISEYFKRISDKIYDWDMQSQIGTNMYDKRSQDKQTMVQILENLQMIETILRENVNSTFDLEQLIAPLDIPEYSIKNAIEILNSAIPSTTDFNIIFHKVFSYAIFLQKNWTMIIPHIYDNFIINNVIKYITDFVNVSKKDINPITVVEKYFPYSNKTFNYHDKIQKNLIDKIKKNRKKANNLYEDVPLTNQLLDQIQFGTFYTNINDNSRKAYVIVSLINDKSSSIIQNLDAISRNTNYIEKLFDIMNKRFSAEYVQETLESFVAPNGYNISALVTSVKNFTDNILTDWQVQLSLPEFTELNTRLNSDVAENIINFINENNPPTQSVALLPGRLISGNFNVNNLRNSTITIDVEIGYLLKQWEETGNVINIASYILAEFYRNLVSEAKKYVTNWVNEIEYNIQESGVSKLVYVETFLIKYLNESYSNILEIFDGSFSTFNNVKNKNNDDKIKCIIMTNDEYAKNKAEIDNVTDVLSTVTKYVNIKLEKVYVKEYENYNLLKENEKNLRENLRESKIATGDRINILKNIVNTVQLVMFSPYFKQNTFVEDNKLTPHVSTAVNNYETILRMINRKITDINSKNNKNVLATSQINNYLAFKSVIGKLISNKAVVPKFYKKMSFGLIEYYYDIADSILTCLDTKLFEDMTEVESYLYQYQYIQLKRVYALFRWIIKDYLKYKQSIEKNSGNRSIKPIIKHKIQTTLTVGLANDIFAEFQGIKRYLDEYSATIMDKVQLHLRINDFEDKKYNNNLRNNYRNEDIDFMLDVSPTSETYVDRWNKQDMIFTNGDGGNNLYVNFNLMDRIYQTINKSTKPFDIYYSDTFQKRDSGIQFERIYNTNIFPDSDVISNYMSIAPNIMNDKGTVIMTYGYSGVGKSASLFGRKADLSKGVDSASNGILQATMDQFYGAKIYFRVYEIYGLGTQFNYYWNPTTDDDKKLCYPEFYQYIIHHNLDTNNPVALKISSNTLYSNQSDILKYIMELKDPKTNSSFAEIGEQHYRNFTDFVKEIDNVREKGITIDRLLPQLVKQIKGTINNPISSRSILVYDFQINTNPENDICIPLLIYDLPGKEDMSKTYIDTSLDTISSKSDATLERSRVFKDIPKDGPSKERKNTYVLNPLLIPIFDDNIDVIQRILSTIKIDRTMETNLVNDILNYYVTNYSIANAENDPKYVPDSATFKIDSLYGKDKPSTLLELLDPTKIFDINTINEGQTTLANNIIIHLVKTFGITAPQRPLTMDSNVGNITQNIITREIFVLVAVVIIGFFIKYKLFDLIIEIIHQVVEGDTLDSNDNGGWSREKIYAFFEAYYINENIVGLLQYLTTKVLGKPSNIKPQKGAGIDDFKIINDEININFQAANRYRTINMLNDDVPNDRLEIDYGFNVDVNLLKEDNDILKRQEIAQFKDDNNIRDDGSFSDLSDNGGAEISEIFRRMKNVISFTNKGTYDTNKIFRTGNLECGENNDRSILNPRKAINRNEKDELIETNRPLLQDFIEPYEQKISFYYIFYVVSNSQVALKAEEQIKLLNNSMPFINKMDPSEKNKLACGKAYNEDEINDDLTQNNYLPKNPVDSNDDKISNIDKLSNVDKLIMDRTGIMPIANQRLINGVYRRIDPKDSKNFIILTNNPNQILRSYLNKIIVPSVTTISVAETSEIDLASLRTRVFVKSNPIVNYGNSCYFGSGLQFIYRMNVVRDYIINNNNYLDPKIIDKKVIDAMTSVKNLLTLMKSGQIINNDGNFDYVSTKEVLTCSRERTQENAFEFLISVLEKLNPKLKDLYIIKQSDDYYMADGKLSYKSFQSEYYINIKFESETLKSPPGSITKSIDQLIKDTFKPTFIDGINAIKDNQTGDHIYTTRITKIYNPLPRYILLTLQVGSYNQGTYIKNKHKAKINVSLSLDIGTGKKSYIMSAMIIHIGEIINSGHYYALTLKNITQDSIVYTKFNDSLQGDETIPINSKYVDSRLYQGDPYVILYEEI